MADFLDARPPDQFNKFDSVGGLEWASRLSGFLQGMAKLPDAQVFTGPNRFQNGTISNSNILLSGGFAGLVEINKVSDNQRDARSSGGNAALYIQHLINGTTAGINNVNCGIRCQVESAQTSTAAVNDLVCFYGGLYQSGVNVGGFGYHLDLYYNGSGGSSTMYGMNVEMNRHSASGVLVGYHLRVITSAFSTVGTDYGFLVSPSVGGTNPCTAGFAVGSSVFGAVNCTVAYDATYATTAVALRLATNQAIQWDGNGALIRALYDGTSWGLLKGGVPRFGLNMNTGTVNFVGGTQGSASAGGASALPATPDGYYNATVNGVPVVFPYYQP